MKKFEAILFDMDGTLLPMEYEAFSRGYLSMLAAEVAPLGYTPDGLIGAMWKGVGAMVKNDGTRTNADAFWATFASILGEKTLADIPHFDAFYSGKFREAARFTIPTPLAGEIVKAAREKADRVILATNPLFPRVAQLARLSWAGLDESDFDLVTDYENSHFCKPNPKYYLEIAEKCGFDPKNALMIGNNAEEDVRAAQAAGMEAWLATDCLIAEGPIPPCVEGTLGDLCDKLEAL